VSNAPGTLDWQPVLDRLELVAEPVAAALAQLPLAADVVVAAIDAELADTAAFCERYAVSLEESANCVVVAGKRGGEVSYAAGLLLATTRLDVNGAVRTRLNARKASFAPLAEAVELTGMQYGGITVIGLPGWPVLIDSRVASHPGMVVIGSGIRGSKLALPAARLAELPGAEVIAELARPIEPAAADQ
jgi:prolyl-tRNA editing enzyme YbaK/EbsC (Cys-tRNA(Pro) deacylase)